MAFAEALVGAPPSRPSAATASEARAATRLGETWATPRSPMSMAMWRKSWPTCRGATPPGRVRSDYLQHPRLHLGHGQQRLHDVQHRCPAHSTQYPWNECSFIGYGGGGVPSWPNAANGMNFANASSRSPGRCQCHVRRRQRQVHQGLDQHEYLVGARNPQRWRSDQL